MREKDFNYDLSNLLLTIPKFGREKKLFWGLQSQICQNAYINICMYAYMKVCKYACKIVCK